MPTGHGWGSVLGRWWGQRPTGPVPPLPEPAKPTGIQPHLGQTGKKTSLPPGLEGSHGLFLKVRSRCTGHQKQVLPAPHPPPGPVLSAEKEGLSGSCPASVPTLRQMPRPSWQGTWSLPYWPELMAISMMESLMCVAGSPCDSTSSGGPGSEMSSRAETSGGESRELVPSGGGRGVESPLWRGALDSSDRERTGEPW